ncbi:transmembrane reductase CYB561D2-like isoform X2 [Topomyia yanbarensis]|uniref:transmembrane reductase CYB561D2-like isoform X2 n=1 Tax=Topomyia yanbarensis TaxID=2498891 RepID=UPI00273CE08B|nr:transmembrane reductase CYB561D2-like isoform X2 [Topomyia yanbarensis]
MTNQRSFHINKLKIMEPLVFAGQYSDNRAQSYQNNVISTVMDEVEADEIVSASQGFGGSAANVNEQKQQPPIVRQQQPVRMLGNKLILLNVLANFLMFAISGFITYHCFNKATVLFSWHPTFMSMGYFIFMSQAVLTLSGGNLLTYKRHHKTRIFIHWLLQAVAGILISVAFVCIFLNKVRMGKAHFQTTHGLFGLVTVIATFISIGGGVFTKYGFQMRQLVRPIYSKIGHAIAGTITYVLSMITISLGVYSAWFQEDNNGQVRLALLVGIIAVALYVIINPITATISRVKSAIRTTL